MRLLNLALIACLTCWFGIKAVSVAEATTVTDPANDFIPTFTGTKSADLDVVSFSVTLTGSVFDLSLTTNGPIGTLPSSLYVFGVNRGAATSNFAAIGVSGVVFDAVITATGTGVLGGRDLVTNTAITFGNSKASINGNTLDVLVDESLLPSLGLTALQYGFSVWPRDSSVSGNGQISDFAPNDGTMTASVPELATWGMLLLGFAGIGAMTYRRKSKPALLTA
jgi:hypothetical protein